MAGESGYSFAKKCGMAESLIRKYLSGESLPGLDKLVTIADAADVRVGWLANNEGPKEKGASAEAPFYSGEGFGWDASLMTDIVEAVEEVLEELREKLIPSEKAKVITRMYEIYAEEGAKPQKQEIRRQLRLVV